MPQPALHVFFARLLHQPPLRRCLPHPAFHCLPAPLPPLQQAVRQQRFVGMQEVVRAPMARSGNGKRLTVVPQFSALPGRFIGQGRRSLSKDGASSLCCGGGRHDFRYCQHTIEQGWWDRMKQSQQAGRRRAGSRGVALATAAALAAAFFVPAQPAKASEVVKLTRLVLTGKRSIDSSKSNPAPTQIERLPKVSVEGLRMEEVPTQIAGQLRAGSRPS